MKHRIVVKVGSLAVTNEKGGVSPTKIKSIISDLHDLKTQGYFPILISSGAINTAKGLIKKPDEKKNDDFVSTSISGHRSATSHAGLYRCSCRI